MRRLQSIFNQLFAPLDIMPLVFIRVMFGGIILWEVWRYFHYDRVFRYYIDPIFYFHYDGFHWLQPLPGDGMIWLFYYLGFLSVCIAVGFLYRLSMIQFWLIFTYIFLLDQTQYLNHFYLISLISFLLMFIPAHRKWSIDTLLFPKIKSETVPAWTLNILRVQMAIVYVYGSIAKMNPDWLAGEPMRAWLAERTDFPLIGQFFLEEWMVYAFSYGGLLFDLLIVPMILWRRTRWLALLAMLTFHLTNAHMFNIGIFPYFSIAITLIFLPAHWFRFWNRSLTHNEPVKRFEHRKVIVVALGVYVLVQLVLPLRHWLFDGYVSWTEQGHNVAWHMKLRSKDGTIDLYASNPETGETRPIPLEEYLNYRQISQMSDNPDMLLSFAHYLVTREEYQHHEIRAWSMMSLNGRASQLLIDPTANLAEQPDDILKREWVLPLKQPIASQPGVPILLMSRRTEGTVVFINITRQPFPLDTLLVTDGETYIQFIDTGVPLLEAGGCLTAHQHDADLTGVFPICNESANRIILSDKASYWQDDSDISVTNLYQIECRRDYCLVIYNG